MILVLLFIINSLGCFALGLSLAGRIAEHKIQEMRLDAGLDIETGEKIQ